jgi:hypothetical protein
MIDTGNLATASSVAASDTVLIRAGARHGTVEAAV